MVKYEITKETEGWIQIINCIEEVGDVDRVREFEKELVVVDFSIGTPEGSKFERMQKGSFESAIAFKPGVDMVDTFTIRYGELGIEDESLAIPVFENIENIISKARPPVNDIEVSYRDAVSTILHIESHQEHPVEAFCPFLKRLDRILREEVSKMIGEE